MKRILSVIMTVALVLGCVATIPPAPAAMAAERDYFGVSFFRDSDFTAEIMEDERVAFPSAKGGKLYVSIRNRFGNTRTFLPDNWLTIVPARITDEITDVDPYVSVTHLGEAETGDADVTENRYELTILPEAEFGAFYLNVYQAEKEDDGSVITFPTTTFIDFVGYGLNMSERTQTEYDPYQIHEDGSFGGFAMPARSILDYGNSGSYAFGVPSHDNYTGFMFYRDGAETILDDERFFTVFKKNDKGQEEATDDIRITSYKPEGESDEDGYMNIEIADGVTEGNYVIRYNAGGLQGSINYRVGLPMVGVYDFEPIEAAYLCEDFSYQEGQSFTENVYLTYDPATTKILDIIEEETYYGDIGYNMTSSDTVPPAKEDVISGKTNKIQYERTIVDGEGPFSFLYIVKYSENNKVSYAYAKTYAFCDLPETGDTKVIKKNTYKVTSSMNKTACFAKFGAKTKKLSVPEEVQFAGLFFKVNQVAKAACKSKKLTKVTLSRNMKKIGADAFRNCKKLKRIVIKSKSFSSVGKNAFKGIYKKAVFVLTGSKKQKKKMKKMIKKSGIGKNVRFK